jgi:hypothetical protein
MPTLRKDHVSLCSFTFADGRQCRTPRHSVHPSLCAFHARKEAQAHAFDQLGRDVSVFFTRDYVSAYGLAFAMGRVFVAAAQGHLKPRTAATLAYLGQTIAQCVALSRSEFGGNPYRGNPPFGSTSFNALTPDTVPPAEEPLPETGAAFADAVLARLQQDWEANQAATPSPENREECQQRPGKEASPERA